MPRLELLHSKEQLFLLDLSQKFYAADHPGFVLGLKMNICMPAHTLEMKRRQDI